MALLGSKQHTEGDTRRWTVKYYRWLDNTASIEHVTMTTSSTSCTVSPATILGQDVVFTLSGGVLGETFTVMIGMTDSLGNIKTDTLSFHVVAP